MSGKKVKVLRRRHFNIVHLIFLFFFIYMLIMVGRYVSKEDIRVCEVTEGTLTQNHNYTGLIFREEELLYARQDGYIQCYVSDGDRVSKDGVIFSLDKTGSSLKADSSAKSGITQEQYDSLRKYLNHFSAGYNGQSYENVYSLKEQLTSAIQSMQQEKIGQQEEDGNISLQKADRSGIVYFTVDGFESVSADSVTRKSLENILLHTTRISNEEKVEKNALICKVITSEEWSVIIPVTNEDAEYYKDKTTAGIYLNDVDATVKAGIEIYQDTSGKNLARLTLHNYMSSYVADRLVSFQLVKPVVTGLKVPKTSVVSSELYAIPVEYALKSDTSNEIKFPLQTRNASGVQEIEMITPDISYVDKQYYYVENTKLKQGDVILKTDKNGKVTEKGSYTIEDKKTLKGVYNVNKGYAVFEVVEILDENDAYCIVEGGTVYGLAVYDHIVLNASSVSEDDLLY